jgi:crotonobetainyl-CoA hydratase
LPVTDVVVEQLGHVVVITLNRPAVHNAITADMATVIGTTLVRADSDEDVRAIVITGAGSGERQTFCSGGDLAAIRRGESIHSTSYPEWGFAGCRRNVIATPVIAAVNGAAIGGGFEIVLACDIAVAADTAWFCLPEGKHGFAGNPGGAYRLAHQIPPAIAREFILTGRRTPAQDALRWGLVNDVVPVADVRVRALQLAAEIAELAPRSTAATKRVAVNPVGDRAAVGYDERAVWQWWAQQPG